MITLYFYNLMYFFGEFLMILMIIFAKRKQTISYVFCKEIDIKTDFFQIHSYRYACTRLIII